MALTDVAPPPPPRLRFTLAESRPPARRWLGIPVPRHLGAVAAGAGVLVLAAALLRGDPFRIPDTVAGMARLSTPAAVDLEGRWQAALSEDGLDGDGGAFGAGGIPAYAVIVYHARPLDAGAALRGVAERWSAATGKLVRTSSTQVFESFVSPIACAPIAGGGYRSICAWADPGGFVGAIVSVDAGIRATLDVAAAARPAVRD